MTAIHEISSGVSNNVRGLAKDKYRNTFSAIGHANEAAATSISGQQSAVALLKAICDELGIATGSGDGAVAGDPNNFDDFQAAMGAPTDSPASDASGAWSAIALAKGVLQHAGFI